MDKIIPLVQFTFDENDPQAGMKAISLVDKPAIESNFEYFNNAKPKSQYFAIAGYEGVVQGLALIPDKPILRYDMEGQPYFGYFTADTIKKLRNSFQKQLMSNNISIDHNGQPIAGYLMESFIIDSPERLADVQSKGIKEATLGSWYVQYKIDDPQVFQKVVDGELKGFSIEAFLQTFLKVNNNSSKIEKTMNKLIERFQSLLDEMKNSTELAAAPSGSSAPAAPSAPAASAPASGDSKSTSAKVVPSGEQVAYTTVGQPVYIIAADGSSKLAPAGSYDLDSGLEIEVDANGNLVEVADPNSPADIAEDSTEPASVDAPAGNMPPMMPMAQYEAEVAKFNAEKVKTEAEKAELNKQIVALKAEVEKLKKAPLAEPVVNPQPETKKFSKEELGKLTNLQRIALQRGIELPKKFAVK